MLCPTAVFDGNLVSIGTNLKAVSSSVKCIFHPWTESPNLHEPAWISVVQGFLTVDFRCYSIAHPLYSLVIIRNRCRGVLAERLSSDWYWQIPRHTLCPQLRALLITSTQLPAPDMTVSMPGEVPCQDYHIWMIMRLWTVFEDRLFIECKPCTGYHRHKVITAFFNGRLKPGNAEGLEVLFDHADLYRPRGTIYAFRFRTWVQ